MNKKIKKIIAVILSVIMIASVMPMAFAADYEIKLGETITVSAPLFDSGEYAYIRFVPEKNGEFALKSMAHDEYDPYCVILDADMEVLETYDDYIGLDFYAKYDFVAGETYYFGVSVYSVEADFQVTLVCVHNYENAVCSKCSKECTHETTEERPYICECGEVFTGKDISVGDELEHDCAEFGNENGWYRFVSEESGIYVLNSVSTPDTSSDPGADVYDVNGEWLTNNDDHDGSLDFNLLFATETGETYYFKVFNFYEDAVFTVRLERFTHTADDGSEHSDMEIVEETYSNCTEHGYSEGVYCNECEKFVSGHEELPLDEGYHPDDDWNDICDLCSAEIFYEDVICEHICHSENWFLAMIWRIANFIHSVFGISPECECGEAHY